MSTRRPIPSQHRRHQMRDDLGERHPDIAAWRRAIDDHFIDEFAAAVLASAITIENRKADPLMEEYLDMLSEKYVGNPAEATGRMAGIVPYLHTHHIEVTSYDSTHNSHNHPS